LEKAPGVSLKDVLQNIALGNTSEDMLTTLANRLIRLERQLSEKDKLKFAEQADGFTINHIVKQLLHAYDPDAIEKVEQTTKGAMRGFPPVEIDAAIAKGKQQLIEKAVEVFHNPDLRDFIVDIRKQYDQIIDVVNMDAITKIGWVKDHASASSALIEDFTTWIESHKDEITALQIFYAQDYRHRTFTYKMIKDLSEKLKTEKPLLAPLTVWRAYEQLEKTNGSTKSELIALVSLIRRVCGIDATLTAYDKTVDKNFQDWIFKKNAGQHNAFTEDQMQWLRMMKDYVANSFHIDRDDFDLSPFNAEGGLSKMWQLFGEETDVIINELNEVLAA
jgi:type I restriction enzyme R subunit